MSTTERAWTEWFTHHLQSVPWQIHHMRELAEHTVSAQDTTAVVVDGTTDKGRLPYRVDPADDADLLYATLIIFGTEVTEKIGGSSPRALRERMWRGRHEPQGLPVCTPHEALHLTMEITRWLTTSAHAIAHDNTLHDAPDDLVRVIRDMRRRYPRAEPRFKAYRPRPCPVCGQATILPIWGTTGLEAMKCDTCGKTWPSNPSSTTATSTPTGKPAPESADTPAPSANGENVDSTCDTTNTDGA